MKLKKGPLFSGDHGSKVIWRSPQLSVNLDRLSSGRLRLGKAECLEPEIQADLRNLIDVAQDCLEDELHIATSLHIREMALPSFPCGSEPIYLDCAPAVSLDEWERYKAKHTDNESWQFCMIQEIESCFLCESSAPVEIVDSFHCGCVSKCYAPNNDFKINCHRQPNELNLIGGSECCNWPSRCTTCERDPVIVRYLCGDLSNCTLERIKPSLAHLVVMIAANLYENPELGEVANLKSVEKFLNQWKNKFRYRP